MDIINPPHLPSQACRVDTHHKLQNLKWIGFIFVAAFLSGVAAALVTVAWIVPIIQEPTGYYVGNYRTGNDSGFLDLAMARQIEQKTVQVVSQKLKINNFVGKQAEVTQAALLSSDGWAVAYYPTYFSGLEKDWQIVDSQGVTYGIEKIVYDDTAKLLYIKISGQGFRINSFVDWSGVGDEVSWWMPGSDWQSVAVSRIKNVGEKIVAVNHLTLFYKTNNPDIVRGALLFSSNGDFSGIIDKDGLVIPSWLVENQISSLLEKKKTTYSTIAWRGFWINGVEQDGKVASLKGFYVSELGAKATVAGLHAGDVILKIDGQSVVDHTLAKQIFSAPKQFNVVVWRKGEEVDLTIDK